MEKKIGIEGMSCMHCVGRVTRFLEGTEGVSGVLVSLGEKNAVFTCDSSRVNVADLIKGINEFGFTASE